MADNDHNKVSILEAFDWEILNMNGSLSQLLFSDDIILGGTNFTDLNLPPSNSPTMLCFQNPKDESNQIDSKKPNPRSPNATDQKKESSVICPSTTPPETACGKSSKRMKRETSESTSSRHAKMKRQGLGLRIAALQQLVSPYGKTDTASVLHEAVGYIRFLHDQVQVLCSPYLEVSSPTLQGGENRGEGSKRKNLGSRGLCLVPAACCSCSTLNVANSNGADFWSPINSNNRSPSV